MWPDHILAEEHPRAFSFASEEDISVKQFLAASSLSMVFHTPHSPQAFEEVHQIQANTSWVVLSPHSQGHDRWTYTWGSETYTAAQFYRFFFRENEAHKSYKWLWKSKCTMKIKVFGWLLLSDRLNTKKHANEETLQYPRGSNYVPCHDHTEETLEHMFFQCSFNTRCWDTLGINWPMQGSRLAGLIIPSKNGRILCSWKFS